MRLSIIIPTLNEGEHIGALLADLAPLRAAGAELILVDGGSSDATLARAANGVDRILQAPRGRAAQMNAGVQAAAGELLWFLHADTRVPAEAVSALQQAWARGACQTPGARRRSRRACFWGRFDVRLSGRHPLLRLVERGMNLRSRLSGIATGDQGLFVAREAFVAVGGFPPLALMEDIALSMALRRLARPVCLRERLLTSSRRWETRGVLRTILLMWRLRLAYALGADPEALARQYAGTGAIPQSRFQPSPSQRSGSTTAMFDWLDHLPLGLLLIIALTLGLAPFVPEPHIWEKLKMLAAGDLVRPIDIFDLLLHGVPWILVLAKLGRLAWARSR